MEFKYAISILFSNLGYVFKVLVYYVLSLIVTLLIGAAIVIPIYQTLKVSTSISVHLEAIRSVSGEVWRGSLNLRAAFPTIVPEAVNTLKAIGENPALAVALAFGGVFLYCIYSFLMGICMYTISDIINKLMTSNLRFGFASAIALNLKRSAHYSLVRLAVCLPVDIVAIAIFAVCGLGFFKIIGVFTMPIILVLFVLLGSARSLLFAGWLPRYLYHENEIPLSSLTRSFPLLKKNVAELFKSFAVTYTVSYLLVNLLLIPTGGLIVLILPPIYHILLRTVELIGYFKTKGFSFYVDGSTVINTVEFGLRRDNQYETITSKEADHD